MFQIVRAIGTIALVGMISANMCSDLEEQQAIAEEGAAQESAGEESAVDDGDTLYPPELDESGTFLGLTYELKEREIYGGEAERGCWLMPEDDACTVYIFGGEHSTGGYQVYVTNISVDDEMNVTITVEETAPGPGDVVIQSFTYPYCVVSLSPIPNSIEVYNNDGEAFDVWQ